MRRKSGPQTPSSEEVVRDIRRATRKHYSAEDKIRIVLDGLRGEHSIAELCRREGIAAGILYPAFGVLLSPIIAAAAMALSSVSVIGNALRLNSAKL